jgi:hypothetical protein
LRNVTTEKKQVMNRQRLRERKRDIAVATRHLAQVHARALK